VRRIPLENERLLGFVKLLLENGLDERVILALEGLPEFASDAANRLNESRATGFRVHQRRTVSEQDVFDAVDELAKRKVPLNHRNLARHLRQAANAVYMRCYQNEGFAERLKSKITSVNGHAE
jgi:hypothetical protein